MKIQMNKSVANLPAVARCGGNEKRVICMSFRAHATIATSFITIRKSNSYKSLSKLVAMVASRARTVTSLGQRAKKSCARLARTPADVM